jgi:hypothetical protein
VPENISCHSADIRQTLVTGLMFEKVTDTNSFKVQDEIIDQVVKALYEEGKIMVEIKRGNSNMSVA